MKGSACLLTVLFLINSGCGQSTTKESLAQRAGKQVGESVTDFAKGVGAGVDQQMKVEVTLSQDLQDGGFTKTIAKSLGIDAKKKGISVYLVSKSPFAGSLVAKALDKDGVEIGRSKVDVTFEKDDAKYIPFAFDNEMDTNLVKRYDIGLTK